MGTLIEIFLTFLKIGSVSFGGGYAMIPLLQDEAIAHGWLTLAEVTNIIAISQVVPGVLAVNMATFVGYTQGGVLGALVAAFGVCLPSFTIIIILSRFFVKFSETTTVKNAFSGLKPATLGLIFSSAFLIGWHEFFPDFNRVALTFGGINYVSMLIAIGAFIAIYKFKLNPILCVLISGGVGLLVF